MNTTTGNGTQPQQNAAHRTEHDLGVWVKVGRSEYRNYAGVTIRKEIDRPWWYSYLPSGEHATMHDGAMKAGGHSLTVAKTWLRIGNVDGIPA